jgi:putative endonuclease
MYHAPEDGRTVSNRGGDCGESGRRRFNIRQHEQPPCGGGQGIPVSNTRGELGRRGEELAVGELVRRGYEVVSRNWRCRVGEVDVVVQRDGAWTFFEVRTRRSRTCGTPEESITPAKQRRMADVALTYLDEHDLQDVDWCLGLVAIEMNRTGEMQRLDVYESIN